MLADCSKNFSSSEYLIDIVLLLGIHVLSLLNIFLNLQGKSNRDQVSYFWHYDEYFDIMLYTGFFHLFPFTSQKDHKIYNFVLS